MNKKIILGMILFFLAVLSLPAHADEQLNKKATIELLDQNGVRIDLTDAVVSIYNDDLSWYVYGERGGGRYPDKSDITFTNTGVTISANTDKEIQLAIYLEGAEAYIFHTQLEFDQLDTVTKSINIGDLNELELTVDASSINSDLLFYSFQSDILKKFDYISTLQGELKSNAAKRLYMSSDLYTIALSSSDGDGYLLYESTIDVQENTSKSILINQDSLNIYNLNYDGYYDDYEYIYITSHEPRINSWFDRISNDIKIMTNMNLEDSYTSLYLSTKKYDIYGSTRSIRINDTNMTIGSKFIPIRLDLSHHKEDKTGFHVYATDQYGNEVRFIDIDRQDDFLYEIYTLDGKLIESAYASMYFGELENQLEVGTYVFRVTFVKERMGTEATTMFQVIKNEDTFWKITGQDEEPDLGIFSGDFKIDLPTTTDVVVSVEINDIYTTDWYYDDVNYLVGRGIVNGYEDSTFRPSNEVRVDAFIKMMVSALGYQLDNGVNYWAQPFIDQAELIGIVGMTDFTDYTRPITRGEMAKIAANTLSLIESPQAYKYYKHQIMDFEAIDNSLQESVMVSMSKGIITGYSDYTFRADELANRAQAATIITRIINTSKRKFVDLFEDKEVSLTSEVSTLVAQMADHNQGIDDAIDYILGYDYDFIPNQNNDQLRQLMFDTITQLEFKISTNVDLTYNGVEDFTAQIGDETWEITLVEDIYRAKLNISDSQFLIFKKIGTKSILFYRDELLNMDYGIEYYADVDEVAINYSLPETYIGGSHHIYYDDDELVSQTIEWNENEYTRNVIYNSIKTQYRDDSKDLYMHDFYEGSKQIYQYSDDNGNGYGLIEFTDGTIFVGEVENYGFSGSGRDSYVDGTLMIGEYDDFLVQGFATMFLPNGITIEDDFDSNVAYSIEGKYYTVDPNLPILDEEIDNIIEANINDSMTTYDKIKSIHNYLVLNITYDTTNVDNELEYHNINNPYSGLVNNSTICLGYSQAMNLIMNELGIESYVVLGDSDKDGTNDHAWNYIKFDDGFFHVDVTWDDPDRGSIIEYDYLKMADSTMKARRDIEIILGYNQ